MCKVYYDFVSRQEDEVKKIKKVAEEAKNVSSKAFGLADSALKQQQNTRFIILHVFVLPVCFSLTKLFLHKLLFLVLNCASWEETLWNWVRSLTELKLCLRVPALG